MESEELNDEIGAIEAIYPDHLTKLAPLLYEFKIPQHESVLVQMSFPEKYPEEKPQIIQVHSDKTARGESYDDRYLESLFGDVLDSIYTEDMVCVFDFFTELDAILFHDEAEITLDEEPETDTHEEGTIFVNQLEEGDLVQRFSKVKVDDEKNEKTQIKNPLEGWISSEPITDRKSTFQAFIKEVHSVDEAMDALELLKQDRKIMRSSHNMTAYRIKVGDIQYQDYDDDGESAAGGRMLHLLTIMDAWNCIVVVSRWFGGVHIGPDRFKHINSTTREAVIKSGLDKKAVSKSKKKK